VVFNQVAYEEGVPPSESSSLPSIHRPASTIWLRPYDVVEPETVTQARGYSRGLPSFDPEHPPAHNGASGFCPQINRPALWQEITTAQTNALNKAIRTRSGR